jgi:membrane-associated protein
MPAFASSSALASTLGAMPTAVAVGVLCAAVIIEIVVLPAVLLPGGTVTLLAGALIGTGRPALAVALPVVAAVIAGDQLAYFGGSVVAGWWRRHRAGPRRERTARRGRAAVWLTAAMPSLAGGAGIGYRSFAARVTVMRVPWLAAALTAGALAARSLAGIGHVAGIAGLAASAVVVGCLLAARLLTHRRAGRPGPAAARSDASSGEAVYPAAADAVPPSAAEPIT